MVLSIDGMIEAYAAETGARVWWLDGLSGNSLPSPVLAGEQIVVPSMDSRSNLAVPVRRRGKLLDEHVLWHGQSVSASMSSPVATEESVYFTNSLTVSERLYGVAAVDGALLVRTGRELIRIGFGGAPRP